LIDVYEDPQRLYLVTEMCAGGELYDLICTKSESDKGAFSEPEAAIITHQILSTLENLHDEHSIVHRDLKPENILLRSSEGGAVNYDQRRFVSVPTIKNPQH